MRSDRLAVAVLLGSALLIPSCGTTTTTVNRESGARPRIEQRAFSKSMAEAYDDVSFHACKGKRTVVETKALDKDDADFINSYVLSRALAAGCTSADSDNDAQIKLLNVVEVSGTDEIGRRKGKGLVVGQFMGTLSIVDQATGKVLHHYQFGGGAQSKRNKKATTRSM